MARKPGLGKGLDALISDESIQTTTEGTVSIPISQISLNPHQPRFQINEDNLQELTLSILEHGIIQPLIVTHEPETGQYTLIAGERRLKAAHMANLKEVPVVVRQATEQQRLELALIENIQRADLTPLETARAYSQLNTSFRLSHEDIARRVGKSRSAVSNTLRLLKLPQAVKKDLIEENISEGHARALLRLNSEEAQIEALAIIKKHGLSVRKTEELVEKLLGQRPIPPPKKETPPEIQDIENRLSDHLLAKVTLRHGKKGGSLTIHYSSDEDLGNLLNRILQL